MINSDIFYLKTIGFVFEISFKMRPTISGLCLQKLKCDVYVKNSGKTLMNIVD